ncbi:hypothetical protein FRB99_000577, partial [Tulasnella sp. 403]
RLATIPARFPTFPTSGNLTNAQPPFLPQSSDHGLTFIERLPAELLFCIFLEVLARLHGPDRFDAPFALAQVSQHWRQLCLDTPYLWTYTGTRRTLSSSMIDENRIAIQLARSGSLQLEVELHWADWEHRQFEELCASIASLAPRLKTLKLTGRTPSPRTILSNRLDDPQVFPLLEDLKLTASKPEDLTSGPQHISCPRIKRLHLVSRSRTLPLPVLSFPTLTELRLDMFATQREEVHLLLQKMPQIETLKLHRARIDLLELFQPLRIVAPCLRQLCIILLQDNGGDPTLLPSKWSWVTAFLRALEAPELRELTYGFESWHTGDQTERVEHGDQKLERFLNLDTVELWNVQLEDDDLKARLGLYFASVRKIKFRTIATGITVHFVPRFVSMLAELVEEGELARLAVVELCAANSRLLHEALGEGKKRLPICMGIDESDIDANGPIPKIRVIVDLGMYCN